MNKKIKIIDLVNRIESGEKVPEKIKYNQLEFKYDKGSGKYIRKNSSIITWFCIERFTSDFLNKTVEILEDKIDIGSIEKIKTLKYNTFNQKQKSLYENMFTLANKLNEVIDKLNEMESKTND